MEYEHFKFNNPKLNTWAIQRDRYNDKRGRPVFITGVTEKSILFKRDYDKDIKEIRASRLERGRTWKSDGFIWSHPVGLGESVREALPNEVANYYRKIEKEKQERQRQVEMQKTWEAREDVKLVNSIRWFFEDEKKAVQIGIDKLLQIKSIIEAS